MRLLDLLQKYWDQIFGIGLVVVGLAWIVKKSVPVGIEGRKPSFTLKGRSALLLGIIVLIVGLFIFFDVINIDWYKSF